MIVFPFLVLILSAAATTIPSLSRSGDWHTSEDHDLATHDVYSWLAQQILAKNDLLAGESHGPVEVPKGSRLMSFRVKDDGPERIPVFVSKSSDNSKDATHAFIAVHGKLRDGHRYWKVLRNAIRDAQRDHFPGSNIEALIFAPQFFSTKQNAGQYSNNQLAWGDLNAWQSGAKATHPEDTGLTSFDALDALVQRVTDASRYPGIKNITIIGHGGGAQLVQRYAAVGKPSRVHVRYIHGDASSCAYFTPDRPETEDSSAETGCSYYNTWRYGFEKFPKQLNNNISTKEYFRRYITRDVVSLVGYDDTKNNEGDQSCMARSQGSDKRRDRNLIWYRYIQTLARTGEDLNGFPGQFSNVADWSDVSNGSSSLRLGLVRNATHDLAEILASHVGREALFSNGDISRGLESLDGQLDPGPKV
ncbi:hypothetical protein NLU13_1303 [Sarocladium strictum]|uniref:Transmembrane protein n=1 Tax=Sarocladium strictum TaxID=5046 RepID=A0AA39LCC5_SARSR|nr:hypothetical protein NLU13_1303 [Sarocladium strictum]